MVMEVDQLPDPSGPNVPSCVPPLNSQKIAYGLFDIVQPEPTAVIVIPGGPLPGISPSETAASGAASAGAAPPLPRFPAMTTIRDRARTNLARVRSRRTMQSSADQSSEYCARLSRTQDDNGSRV